MAPAGSSTFARSRPWIVGRRGRVLQRRLIAQGTHLAYLGQGSVGHGRVAQHLPGGAVGHVAQRCKRGAGHIKLGQFNHTSSWPSVAHTGRTPAAGFVVDWDGARDGHALHGHAIGGEGAGLVGANHRRTAQGFHGGQHSHNGVFLGHFHGAKGQTGGHHSGQAFGDGGHGQSDGNFKVLRSPPQSPRQMQ